MDPETEEIRVRCERVANMPEPRVASVLRTCSGCSASMWASSRLVEQLARDHPRQPISFWCGGCITLGEGDELRLPAGQLADFREAGLSDAEVAGLLALFAVAGVGASREQLHALQRRIAKEPFGRQARRYRKELARACQQVEAAAASVK